MRETKGAVDWFLLRGMELELYQSPCLRQVMTRGSIFRLLSLLGMIVKVKKDNESWKMYDVVGREKK